MFFEVNNSFPLLFLISITLGIVTNNSFRTHIIVNFFSYGVKTSQKDKLSVLLKDSHILKSRNFSESLSIFSQITNYHCRKAIPEEMNITFCFLK